MGVARSEGVATQSVIAVTQGLVYLERQHKNIVNEAASTVLFMVAHQALMTCVVLSEVTLALAKTIPAVMQLTLSSLSVKPSKQMSAAHSFSAVRGHCRRALKASGVLVVIPFVVAIDSDLSKAEIFRNCVHRYTSIEIKVKKEKKSWKPKVWNQNPLPKPVNTHWALPAPAPETQVVAPAAPIIRLPTSARTELQEAAYADICNELRLVDVITLEPFTDPVTDATGQTSDRGGFLEWVGKHNNSPVTRTPFPLRDGASDKSYVKNKLIQSTLKTIDNLVREKAGAQENSASTKKQVVDEVIHALRLECPKTGNPFDSPVIVTEAFGDFQKGVTYEKSAAEEGMRLAGSGRVVDDYQTKILRDALAIEA